MTKQLFAVILLFNALMISGYGIAHSYFFCLTELSINPNNQQLEVIHTLTAHDLENLIAQQQQINFNVEHSKYQQIITQYIAQHFEISYKNNKIPLHFVGIEMSNGKVIVYQENKKQTFLSGLLVKNDLLVDTYAKQINTVNYQDTAKKGSLTFDINHRILQIK